jgi:hypothetical protein
MYFACLSTIVYGVVNPHRLMPIRIQIEPTFHFDADPDPDPSSDLTLSCTHVGMSEI